MRDTWGCPLTHSLYKEVDLRLERDARHCLGMQVAPTPILFVPAVKQRLAPACRRPTLYVCESAEALHMRRLAAGLLEQGDEELAGTGDEEGAGPGTSSLPRARRFLDIPQLRV